MGFASSPDFEEIRSQNASLEESWGRASRPSCDLKTFLSAELVPASNTF